MKNLRDGFGVDLSLRAWQHCGVALLSDIEVEKRLAGLLGWERSGSAIVKTFKRGDFVGSVEFVSRLVEPAEGMNHHPDLAISWDEVAVTLSTHSEGGLTAADFELAEKIDALA
jgi:4a-hydroxytetrahydrobiopterin dehydratase